MKTENNKQNENFTAFDRARMEQDEKNGTRKKSYYRYCDVLQ